MIAKKRTRVPLILLSLISILMSGVASGWGQAPAPGQAPPSTPLEIDRLKLQIERVIRDADGKVGVAVRHLESGQGLAINGDMPFPMASTFKLPVLVELFFQAKEGRFSLDDEISVQPSDQHLGSGLIAKMAAPGITLSLRNMAHLMMLISDNSAADILLEKVGAASVNARLKSLGIAGISVNRSCQKLIADFLSLRAPARTPDEIRAAVIKFGENPEDQAAPAAMNALLEKIFKKEIIDPASCDAIIEIMLKCETGEKRIRSGLPQDSLLAHKTGTIAGTVNDCGVIFLPDGAGRVALTVLTKDFTGATADVEEIIARIARFAYDCFYFTM